MSSPRHSCFSLSLPLSPSPFLLFLLLFPLSLKSPLTVFCMRGVLRMVPPELGVDSEANFHSPQREVTCWLDFLLSLVAGEGDQDEPQNCPVSSAPLFTNCSHNNSPHSTVCHFTRWWKPPLWISKPCLSAKSQQAALHGAIKVSVSHVSWL